MIETLLAPFALIAGLFAGGWVVTAIVCVWMLVTTGMIVGEKGWGAFWLTAITIGVLAIAGVNVPMYIWSNPMMVLEASFQYLVLGLIWSSTKFFIKLRKARHQYLTDKKEAAGDSIEQEKKFIQSVKSSPTKMLMYAPRVRDFKSDLVFWMFWWPFSIIDFFLEDFVKHIVDAVWSVTKNIFEGIRKVALGQAAKDLEG